MTTERFDIRFRTADGAIRACEPRITTAPPGEAILTGVVLETPIDIRQLKVDLPSQQVIKKLPPEVKAMERDEARERIDRYQITWEQVFDALEALLKDAKQDGVHPSEKVTKGQLIAKMKAQVK